VECLRGVQLEVEFKPDTRPIFCKPRSVPFAMQEDLAQACDFGIAKGTGRLRHSMNGGTPEKRRRLPTSLLHAFAAITLQPSTLS